MIRNPLKNRVDATLVVYKTADLNKLNFNEIINRRASWNARPKRVLITFGRLLFNTRNNRAL